MDEENETQRELTLDEWCQKLPENHLVNKQLQRQRELLRKAEAMAEFYSTHWELTPNGYYPGIPLSVDEGKSAKAWLQEYREVTQDEQHD